MSLKPESNHISSILQITSTRTGCFLKTCLLSALILPVLLASQPVKAESQPILELNAGLNDAWFNPATGGQGFFIIVFPEIKQVFLAWFTYDTERPAEDVVALLGEPGHRWLTAQGPYDGNTANLTIFVTEGGVFDSAEPAAATDLAGDGTITLEFADCTEGLVNYEITSLGISGEIPIQRIVPDKIALCEALAASAPDACTRPDPDISHGLDDPPIVAGATIPVSEVFDGGPGPDGIPPLEFPQFTQNLSSTNLNPLELVVGVKVGDDIRAYPHNILNWHEVVNDRFTMDGMTERATLNYCPLTGSAMLWKSFMEPGNETFGTSGLLYNSNLIMYDRATSSFWSQMLEQSVAGPQIQRIPDRLQVVETSWVTWKAMYPETLLLTEQTGFSRDYNAYPYGSFRTNQSLLFPANNSNDDRLHRKERVLGINVGSSSKVYPITNFSTNIEVINETVGNMQVVVAGSGGYNFGVVFNRELEDCTVLDFEAVQDKLPVVMRDNEGNDWDVFGTAVSGARTGQQLQKTNSYISYWYAWTAFFPGAEIYQ
ncbi:MAG: DUF3179 domain-containing protein [Proteobacteria bacterium]|nr:DUF3179 domain-containing protein [Pseudomonadota bacterium]